MCLHLHMTDMSDVVFVPIPIILICMMPSYLLLAKAFSPPSLILCVPQRLYSSQEALRLLLFMAKVFSLSLHILGIWITIPLWLRICWPNEPTWLIDTGDHDRSHSSSPVNKHGIFHPPNVSLIMDHFNPVGRRKENPIQTANMCLTMPDHRPTPSIHMKRERRLPGISKIWNDDWFLGSQKS